MKWKFVSFVRRSTLVREDYHFICIKECFHKLINMTKNFKITPLFIHKCIIHQAIKYIYTKIKKAKLIVILNRMSGILISFITIISMIIILVFKQPIDYHQYFIPFFSTNKLNLTTESKSPSK